jgi:hypothetical protein
VNNLGEWVEKLFFDQVMSPVPTGEVINLSVYLEPSSYNAKATVVSSSINLELSLSRVTLGPIVHYKETHHRIARFGVVYTTLDPPPVTGVMNHTKLPSDKLNCSDSALVDWHVTPFLSAAMPDMLFPKFDGSNPRPWIKHYETFFDVYHVDPRLWIHYSTMHVTPQVFGFHICTCIS